MVVELAIGAAAVSGISGVAGFLTGRKQKAALNIEAIDNRDDFLKFCEAAFNNKQSAEYKELYSFLLRVFMKADRDFDGLVTSEDFDMMVEMAGSLPRMVGLAPSSLESFPNTADRQKYRDALFKKIDKDGSRGISYDEWLEYCITHIKEKVSAVNRKVTSKSMADNKESFKSFVITACKDRSSMEYKDLYRELLKCFVNADRDMDGRVSVKEFDEMIEIAAAWPRRYGFAPESSATYKNADERVAARAKMFEEMDADKNGYITFEEWLRFCYAHICEKTATLDPTLTGVPPSKPKSSGGCPFGFDQKK